MKYLIDECLTTKLVTLANQAGGYAEHVARVGKAGWKDWNVLRYASEGDFVLVTNNAADFRKLYATETLHAGLVIIVPNVSGAWQESLFQEALRIVTGETDLINRVLEMDIDGEAVTHTLYELPPS